MKLKNIYWSQHYCIPVLFHGHLIFSVGLLSVKIHCQYIHDIRLNTVYVYISSEFQICVRVMEKYGPGQLIIIIYLDVNTSS